MPLNTTVFALSKSRSSISYTINYWDDHSAHSVWSARVYFNSMMLTQNSFRNNTTSSINVMGHGFPSKIFFSADHSTMPTSKALHITFSN